MNRISLVLAQALIASSATLAPAEPWAIVDGTVHPIAGPAIERGVVLIDGADIVAVGSAASVRVPDGAAFVDATGLHVWPGLTDALSYLGLTEISSVRGTVDLSESGAINPNARAEVAINASTSHVPVTRSNGTLLAAAVPTGSLVPGTAAAIALDGWTWEEMVRKAPVGLVIQWPSMQPSAPNDDDDEAGDMPKWEERVARLTEMIEEARAYEAALEAGEARDDDVRWESLRTVVRGETPVWIQASSFAEIRAAMDWTDRHGLRMVLLDGRGSSSGDAWRCATELEARGIPVVLRTNRVPPRRYEPYDMPFAAPARLHEAGVAIAFGTWNSAHARNLPQEAARAVAFGLPRDAAERALTLGGAELLGIDDRYGSIEEGKSATLLLVDGDVLETTMNVERAWIDGREIDLDDRHKQLHRQWSARPTAGEPGAEP